jgi:hypothetical protein
VAHRHHRGRRAVPARQRHKRPPRRRGRGTEWRPQGPWLRRWDAGTTGTGLQSRADRGQVLFPRQRAATVRGKEFRLTLDLEPAEEGRVEELLGELRQDFEPFLALWVAGPFAHMVWVRSDCSVRGGLAIQHLDLGYPLSPSELLCSFERRVFVPEASCQEKSISTGEDTCEK